jgi:hypothetical protein
LSIRSVLLVATVMSSGAAFAQTAGEDVHGAIGPDIIVTAPFERERFALPTAVGVLEGEALTREVRGTIGETLARQPGVTATFFGPNASRPILRGFDGERVRILTDGIGSFDVSNTSVDHAVAINPLNATRIEIIRGPASLLYGSGAIGGVVNVTDRRIAREIPDEFAHIDAIGTLASVNDERSISGSVDMPSSWLKPRIAFSGVRSSWLILDRNSVLAALARSARSVAAASSRRTSSWSPAAATRARRSAICAATSRCCAAATSSISAGTANTTVTVGAPRGGTPLAVGDLVMVIQMQGAEIQAGVQRNQIEGYRARVQAYAERIGADKVKFDAYASQVAAEAAKSGIVESEARAYAALVAGPVHGDLRGSSKFG